MKPSPIAKNLQKKLSFLKNDKIAIAVSGGSDSMALLLAISEFYPKDKIYCLSVNHNLRKESAKDCQFVANFCQKNRKINFCTM